MIIVESYINPIDGRELVRTWSNEGRYVCRDGKQWEEAIDPPNTGRIYIEGDFIPGEDVTAEEAVDILLGGLISP